MTYRFVKCHKFATKDPSTGVLRSLQCKLCGTVIGDVVEKAVGYENSRGGQLVKVVTRQFMRFSNYTEIKIAFEDPLYYHVTNGCDKCLHMHLPVNVLAELHAADQEDSPDGYTDREKAQVPLAVMVLRHDQSGIV